MLTTELTLTVMKPGDFFPPVENAWGIDSDAPGLLAAGGDLSVKSLYTAYGKGIFPWFSKGQPILWWSTDPRMVLQMRHFKLHRSFKRTLKRFINAENCEIRIDSAFSSVIAACSETNRAAQSGTWIGPEMVKAYTRLHEAGHAHSIETWVAGELVGGLYCVSVGHAVFGESMFTKVADASKIALAALVAFCRAHSIPIIDCQQYTGHLASLGAATIDRSDFTAQVASLASLPSPHWEFEPVFWNQILNDISIS